MKRTTIMLPEDLKARAENRARNQGVSLGELVRLALERLLERTRKGGGAEDPLFADEAVHTGKNPRDLSEHHDRYLYGEGD